jgi:hypothetical protein
LQQIDFNGHPAAVPWHEDCLNLSETEAIGRRGGAAMLGSLQRLVLVLSLILGSGRLAKAQGTPNRVAFVQSSPTGARIPHGESTGVLN